MRSISNVIVKTVLAVTCSAAVNWSADLSVTGSGSTDPRSPLEHILTQHVPNPNSRLGPLQSTVRSVACEEGIAPDFALAIIEHESKFNNAMRGSHGEIGASQILPATATALGLDTARLAGEFVYNARAGVRILKMLLRRSAGDEKAAACCYRAGPSWTKLPGDTQLKVLAYAGAIQRLKRNYSGLDCRP